MSHALLEIRNTGGLSVLTLLQNSHSPVIVGEHYDLAETLALKQGSDHNGGLLGKPDYQSALLSMSSVDGKGSIDGKCLITNFDEPHTFTILLPSQTVLIISRRPESQQSGLLFLPEPQLQPNTILTELRDRITITAK